MNIQNVDEKYLEDFFEEKVSWEENEVGIFLTTEKRMEKYTLKFDLYPLPNHFILDLFFDEKLLISASKDNVEEIEILELEQKIKIFRLSFIGKQYIDIQLKPLKIVINTLD